jgi:hypothetical protein
MSSTAEKKFDFDLVTTSSSEAPCTGGITPARRSLRDSLPPPSPASHLILPGNSWRKFTSLETLRKSCEHYDGYLVSAALRPCRCSRNLKSRGTYTVTRKQRYRRSHNQSSPFDHQNQTDMLFLSPSLLFYTVFNTVQLLQNLQRIRRVQELPNLFNPVPVPTYPDGEVVLVLVRSDIRVRLATTMHGH